MSQLRGRCSLNWYTAPGQDYSLPLVKVGKSKLMVQPDRKSLYQPKEIVFNFNCQRALATNGRVLKPWKI
jgi:hypothetical protein